MLPLAQVSSKKGVKWSVTANIYFFFPISMVVVEILSSGRHTCEALKTRERRAVKSYLKKNITNFNLKIKYKSGNFCVPEDYNTL